MKYNASVGALAGSLVLLAVVLFGAGFALSTAGKWWHHREELRNKEQSATMQYAMAQKLRAKLLPVTLEQFRQNLVDICQERGSSYNDCQRRARDIEKDPELWSRLKLE